MTSLNKHLPLEVVKQNEALQEIEPWTYYVREEILLKKNKWQVASPTFIKDTGRIGEYNSHHHPRGIMRKLCPAPTIADVIDNAEELFGDKLLNNYSLKNYQHHSHQLIEMCQQDKSIEDISSYIISNLLKE